MVVVVLFGVRVLSGPHGSRRRNFQLAIHSVWKWEVRGERGSFEDSSQLLPIGSQGGHGSHNCSHQSRGRDGLPTASFLATTQKKFQPPYIEYVDNRSIDY